MSIPYVYQLHYRCSFRLDPRPGIAAGWDDLVRSVRDWVSNRTGRQDDLGRRWFFAGGGWKPAGMPGFRVETATCPGTGSDDRPEHWALRYEHPCEVVPVRHWRTDIGLTAAGDGGYDFALTTAHAVRPGYIGDEPPAPRRRPPGSSPGCSGRSGGPPGSARSR